MGLEDFSQEGGKGSRKPSTGRIGFLRHAADESRKRNIGQGGEIWADVWDARKKAYPLRMERMTSAKVVFLNEGEDLLAHQIVTRWVQGTSGNFPNKEFVRCVAYEVGEGGAWLSTGKSCPFCTYLGRDPRIVILWALADLRQFRDKATGEVKKVSVRRVEIANEDILGAIWDGVEVASRIQKVEAHVKHAMFQVSRSGGEKTPGYGNSWVFEQWVDEKQCEEYASQIPDWKRGWPAFEEKAALAIIEKDHKIRIEKMKGEGFSEEGYLRLFGKAAQGEEKKEPEAKPDKPKGGGLEDLSDGGAADKPSKGGKGKKAEASAEPTLDGMDDIGDGDDMDFDPWEDGDV